MIFTPSLGVLKERHEELFNPALPAKKVDAIKGLSIGAVAKMYMRFETPFWLNGWGGIHVLWTDKFLQKLNSENDWLGSVMAFLAVDGQPSTLCAWIAGDKVRQVEQIDEKLVAKELLELLRSMVPDWVVPEPVQILR